MKKLILIALLGLSIPMMAQQGELPPPPEGPNNGPAMQMPPPPPEGQPKGEQMEKGCRGGKQQMQKNARQRMNAPRSGGECGEPNQQGGRRMMRPEGGNMPGPCKMGNPKAMRELVQKAKAGDAEAVATLEKNIAVELDSHIQMIETRIAAQEKRLVEEKKRVEEFKAKKAEKAKEISKSILEGKAPNCGCDGKKEGDAPKGARRGGCCKKDAPKGATQPAKK